MATLKLNQDRKTALVTGASSGIGYALAERLAADGYQLVLVAKRRRRLSEAARRLGDQYKVAALARPVDLADPAAITDLVADLNRRRIKIDVLVNNAGFGSNGPFVATDLDDELAMIQVNTAALTQLSKLLLPAMLRTGFGRIMNVSSMAGFVPGPLMAVYFATKAYVTSFSEALAAETAGSGVTVTALCPGPTGTGFQRRAGMPGATMFRRPDSAERVAAVGYRAMKQGRPLAIVGWRHKLALFMLRLVPRQVAALAGGRGSRR